MKWIKRILCSHEFSEPVTDRKRHRHVKVCKKCGKKEYIAYDIQH